MGILAECLPPANVLVGIDAKSMKKLFELVSVFFESRYALSRSEVYEALFKREKLGPTLLGFSGLAMPHAVLASLSDILCVLVHLEKPVMLRSMEKGVSIFLFVLVPPSLFFREKAEQIYREWSALAQDDNIFQVIDGVLDPAALHQYVCHFAVETAG